MHKKSPDIEFEDVGILGVVRRCSSDKAIKAPDTKEGALTCSTSVRVINKGRFKEWIEFGDNQVMDDTVSKICGKDFSLDRLVDNKGNRFSPIKRSR